MQGIDIRLRWSCPRANGGGDAYRDEDAHFARRQAFGLDDIDSSTHYVEHAAKTLFLMWVTLTEHKWVTLGERRGLPEPRKMPLVSGHQVIGAGSVSALQKLIVVGVRGRLERASSTDHL